MFPDRAALGSEGNHPAFFEGVSQFYSYIFDGRINQIMRCVFDELSETLHNQYKIMMYMNFTDFSRYQHCENTYWGYIEHYDAVTNIVLTNQDHPMLPIAMKMLFSRTPLKEDLELVKKLKVSKEDIRLLKLYNMLSVT